MCRCPTRSLCRANDLPPWPCAGVGVLPEWRGSRRQGPHSGHRLPSAIGCPGCQSTLLEIPHPSRSHIVIV
eukprot:249469-Pyramimonas_sp.AAC.1